MHLFVNLPIFQMKSCVAFLILLIFAVWIVMLAPTLQLWEAYLAWLWQIGSLLRRTLRLIWLLLILLLIQYYRSIIIIYMKDFGPDTPLTYRKDSAKLSSTQLTNYNIKLGNNEEFWIVSLVKMFHTHSSMTSSLTLQCFLFGCLFHIKCLVDLLRKMNN